MLWPWQSGSSSLSKKLEEDTSFPHRFSNWNESLNVKNWDHYTDPRTWVPALVSTTVIFGGLRIYRIYLRRISNVDYVFPHYYRKRTLFGKVTSVGDGDGFHLFHTPGGRLAGWGWLRKIPTTRKTLKGQTIPIRIAGIDAPEGAHFGRPAQPHASEALRWLSASIIHRYVYAHIYRRDQYDRVVATVYVRRFLFFRRDVGLEMVRLGLATTYEAKSGAEFGGELMEKKYREVEAEAKKKNLGLWGALVKTGKTTGWLGLGKVETKSKEPFETPREFKDRMKLLDKAEKGEKK